MYNGFMRYANSMDLFGANVYGPAATGFVSKVSGIQGCTGWNRPFFASEFGMVRAHAPRRTRRRTCAHPPHAARNADTSTLAQSRPR
jgi:hypothetical protein